MTLSQPHLEEEHKADPLIEGVPDNLLLVVEVRDGAHPGVGDHHAHLLADQQSLCSLNFRVWSRQVRVRI